MPRFLSGWLLGLAGAAIGLVLSDVLFTDFEITYPQGFVVALLIFALLSAILTPLVFRTVRRSANSVIALTGLFSTFIALLLTALLTDGLSITSIGAWVGSTALIWLLGMFIWVIPGPWRNHKKADRA